MENRLAHSSAQSESLLSTHKVLRNTYLLLGMTLVFSSVIAFVAMSMNAPALPWWGVLAGFYGLLFLTNATANSGAGILSVFALTGFLGYTLGGVIANIFLHIPALSLALSGLFVIFSSGAILLTTSNIIHNGETNYIRATVDLYVSLYNLFVSFLQIFGVLSSDD